MVIARTIMQQKKKPLVNPEFPQVPKPEVKPPVDPEDPLPPPEDPDYIPEEDPFENPPYEVPPPAEGP